MPFDLSLATVAALAIALLGAAYVRGYSGFGFSAIFIAFAALLTNPLPLIPVVFASEIVMTSFQARGIRGQVDWRRVFPLLIGAGVILPFAIRAMIAFDVATVRLTVSGIIFVLALVLFSGFTLRKPVGVAGHGVVGLVSGICNSAGVGGLPVATFLTAQPITAPHFRATMIVYLTGLDLITLPLMWHGGLISGDSFWALALALPVLGLGVWLGGRRFMSSSADSFRRFAVFLLLILSALGLLRPLLT
ncbi:sulfite exporter TauE/SafE family protein [Loktanella sp. D2R18]|uniref:TSUP family transporter n=1 Tax=Rhodobacterales TaxID=204455 RepID=UPI000DE9CEF4|nr:MULTISPECIES: TSUP family transporter [Rhodobacterales]MDO6588921.1 TSUP family transporter [Yoonia sp. 1_MG-2023]RBW41860.1 sulfite exporter TauE/SafE family protein [Loktanella sp. D2R18]